MDRHDQLSENSASASCKGYQSTRHTVISSQASTMQVRRVKRAMVIQLRLWQRQFFRTPHDQTPKTGAGSPKFSGHADIKGHYQRVKFGYPRPLRREQGVNVFFDPSSLKIRQIFEIFHILLKTIQPTNGEKYRKIVGSIFEKISLEIKNFQIFPILWLGHYLAIFKSIFN